MSDNDRNILLGQLEEHVLDGMATYLLTQAIRQWQERSGEGVTEAMVESASRGDLGKAAAADLAKLIVALEDIHTDYPMAELYMHAMEAHEGRPYELVSASIRHGEPDLVVSSNQGQFGPQNFVGRIERSADLVMTGVDLGTLDAVRNGPGEYPQDADDPGDDDYYEAFNDLENSALVRDMRTGVDYTVYQSEGDIWLIPKDMEWSEKEDWYVWPDGAIPLADSPYYFGSALAGMALDTNPEIWWHGFQLPGGKLVKAPHKRFKSELYDISQKTMRQIFDVTFDGTSLTWKGEVVAP